MGVNSKGEVTRYILMRHDESQSNHDYLWPRATIHSTVGEGRAAIDIVQITGDDDIDVERRSWDQLDRLYSGLESRGYRVFKFYEAAFTEATAQSQITAQMYRDEGLVDKTEGVS